MWKTKKTDVVVPAESAERTICFSDLGVAAHLDITPLANGKCTTTVTWEGIGTPEKTSVEFDSLEKAKKGSAMYILDTVIETLNSVFEEELQLRIYRKSWGEMDMDSWIQKQNEDAARRFEAYAHSR